MSQAFGAVVEYETGPKRARYAAAVLGFALLPRLVRVRMLWLRGVSSPCATQAREGLEVEPRGELQQPLVAAGGLCPGVPSSVLRRLLHASAGAVAVTISSRGDRRGCSARTRPRWW